MPSGPAAPMSSWASCTQAAVHLAIRTFRLSLPRSGCLSLARDLVTAAAACVGQVGYKLEATLTVLETKAFGPAVVPALRQRGQDYKQEALALQTKCDLLKAHGRKGPQQINAGFSKWYDESLRDLKRIR